MNSKIEKVSQALYKNNITPIFAKDTDEAVEIIRKMLFPNAIIAAGGSQSLAESGVLELIKSPSYNFRDRLAAGLSEEQKQSIFRDIIGADFYFCSANAITENGELINVDGFANRVSALAFGPKKVIVVAGVNKIVADAQEGFLRIKSIAAPKNCVRLKKDTPCAKLGHCVSLEKSQTPDITEGCDCGDRICRHYCITAKQADSERITVILVDSNLGY